MKSLATTFAFLSSVASAVDLRTRDAYLTGAEPLSDLAQSDRQEEIDTTLAQTKGWQDQITPPFKWIRESSSRIEAFVNPVVGSNTRSFYDTIYPQTFLTPWVPKWESNKEVMEIKFSYITCSARGASYTPFNPQVSHFYVDKL